MKTKTYPNLCDSFKELAAWTNSTLNKSYSLKMAFNEETITEHLLLVLAERHSGRDLTIRAYTKQEEGTGTKSTNGRPTGADWAFWFANTQNKGIELRIQAKRLFSSGKYESLDGTGQQKQDLINNSGKAIPLYVLYNGSSKLKTKSNNLFYEFSVKNYPCCYFNESDWGCTIASPNAIPRVNQPTPSQIHYMMPWHKLVCGSQSSLPEQVAFATKAAYKEYINQKSESEPYAIDANQDPPVWVEKLDIQVTDEENEFSELDKYMSENNLYGVVYIKEKIE